MLDIKAEKTSQKIQNFILSVCEKESILSVLVGLSGGIDSATSLTLSAKALGIEHVYPVLLPCGNLNGQEVKDAQLIIKELAIPQKQVRIIDIKPYVDSLASYDKSFDEIRLGNIMARIRMIILYDLSRKHNFLVVGTENKTEHLLGYYTRFGDEASDIEPLRGLYKTQVYMLAKHLKVSNKILTKPPTAGLWEGQTDEEEFGFSYIFADEILCLLTEKKMSKDEILARGYDKTIIERVWWWIEKGNFKERVPYVLQ